MSESETWARLEVEHQKARAEMPEKDKPFRDKAHQATLSVARGLLLQRETFEGCDCGDPHDNLTNDPEVAYGIAQRILSAAALLGHGAFGALCGALCDKTIENAVALADALEKSGKARSAPPMSRPGRRARR